LFSFVFCFEDIRAFGRRCISGGKTCRTEMPSM